MKSKLILVCLFALLVQTVNGQVFGIKGGVNLASMSFSEDTENSVKSILGFHVGPIAEFELQESLFFNTGLLFSIKGAKMDYGNENATTSLNYLEVPLNVAYKFSGGEKSKVFIQAGPYLGYGLSGKSKYGDESEDINFKDDGIKRFDFGLGFGLGIELGSIVPSVSYQFGLSNLNDDSEDEMTVKNNVFQISIAYMFGKK
jgi:hypothetical protein